MILTPLRLKGVVGGRPGSAETSALTANRRSTWRGKPFPVKDLPSPLENVVAPRAGVTLAPSPHQCLNKNSFELISAHCTSSHALRLSLPLATCCRLAWTSPSAGSRHRLA